MLSRAALSKYTGRANPETPEPRKTHLLHEPAATPSPCARRPRRAVNYYDSEPDDDDEEDLELAPPDDEDGWD